MITAGNLISYAAQDIFFEKHFGSLKFLNNRYTVSVSCASSASALDFYYYGFIMIVYEMYLSLVRFQNHYIARQYMI